MAFPNVSWWHRGQRHLLAMRRQHSLSIASQGRSPSFVVQSVYWGAILEACLSALGTNLSPALPRDE